MLRVLLITAILGLGACATASAIPEDFNADFEF